MIRPADNNPFKFSTSEAMTMLQLLSKNDPAYLSGANAISEGFDDINAHQMAVVAGMEAALQNILARFNPKTLETKMTSDSVLDRILPVGKKARHWDVFKLLFDEIAGEAEDDFQKLFGREFSHAYEEQLSRLKNTR
jgi:type VI secretion system protein